MGACQSDPRPQGDILISNKERTTIEKPINIKIPRNRRSNIDLKIAPIDQKIFNDNLKDFPKNEVRANLKENKIFSRTNLIKNENLRNIVENNVEDGKVEEHNILTEFQKNIIIESHHDVHSKNKNDLSFKDNNSRIPEDDQTINISGFMKKEENPIKKPNLLRCNGGANLENSLKNLEENKNNHPNNTINDSAFEESSIFKLYPNTDRRINDTLNNTNILDNDAKIHDNTCMLSGQNEEEEELGKNRYNISQISKNKKHINLSVIMGENKQIVNDENDLYIITIIDNLSLSPQKQKLYSDFKQKIFQIKNARLITMEYTSMGLPFIATKKYLEPFHYQMRNENNFNPKFSYYNLLIKKLPSYMKYLAFIDYEIEVLEEEWINETLNHLKNGANFVKMNSDFIFTNKNGEIFFPNAKSNKTHNLFNLGFIFASKRQFLAEIEGFPDFLMIEESDEIVTACIENKLNEILPENINNELKLSIFNWAKKIEEKEVFLKVINKTITRYISEKTKKKIEKNGWSILIDNQFDPARDLVRNKDGISCLKKEKEKMMKELKEYFFYIHNIID